MYVVRNVLYNFLLILCLVQLEPVVQPVSNPNSAVVPMEYQYAKPDIEPPAFINPYVNEQIKIK